MSEVQALSHAVRALRRLHSCGYAHRDIKPGNILRRPKQHDWTLIDFGCTAQIGTPMPALSLSNHTFQSHFPNTKNLTVDGMQARQPD